MFNLAGLMLNKNVVFIVGIGILILFIGIKYKSLTSEIRELTLQVERLNNKINTITLENTILESNAVELEKALKACNASISKLEVDKSLVEDKLKDYMNKPLVEKVDNPELKKKIEELEKYKHSCQYGLELNEVVSRMKYEDL